MALRERGSRTVSARGRHRAGHGGAVPEVLVPAQRGAHRWSEARPARHADPCPLDTALLDTAFPDTAPPGGDPAGPRDGGGGAAERGAGTEHGGAAPGVVTMGSGAGDGSRTGDGGSPALAVGPVRPRLGEPARRRPAVSLIERVEKVLSAEGGFCARAAGWRARRPEGLVDVGRRVFAGIRPTARPRTHPGVVDQQARSGHTAVLPVRYRGIQRSRRPRLLVIAVWLLFVAMLATAAALVPVMRTVAPTAESVLPWTIENIGGPTDPAPPVAPAPAEFTTALPDARAQAAVDAALSQVGVPYEWGGNGPAAGDQGFDCSGLTTYAYGAAGITLPRTAHAQYVAGPHVPADAPLQPGDLVFYGTSAAVHHVGLYLGDATMVNAPTFGQPVQTSYYRWRGDDYLGATRPAASGPTTSGLLEYLPTPLTTSSAPRIFEAPKAPLGPRTRPASTLPAERVTAAAAMAAADHQASTTSGTPAAAPARSGSFGSTLLAAWSAGSGQAAASPARASLTLPDQYPTALPATAALPATEDPAATAPTAIASPAPAPAAAGLPATPPAAVLPATPPAAVLPAAPPAAGPQAAPPAVPAAALPAGLDGPAPAPAGQAGGDRPEVAPAPAALAGAVALPAPAGSVAAQAPSGAVPAGSDPADPSVQVGTLTTPTGTIPVVAARLDASGRPVLPARGTAALLDEGGIQLLVLADGTIPQDLTLTLDGATPRTVHPATTTTVPGDALAARVATLDPDTLTLATPSPDGAWTLTTLT
ncbi:hypothetical protein GCM10009836_71960 [Pseudonocardia ailaonensis]|uniref:NlpC/P60 domain-containing protein n=1 Tax=Pseudonocardia ailaonensis TaxID=367279 RepID=A0ABN2NPF1_9PSEU